MDFHTYKSIYSSSFDRESEAMIYDVLSRDIHVISIK